MEKDKILKQIEVKILPAVKNLENGNASEHDIFPSLLWLLLENSHELEKSTSLAKDVLSERIGNLKQVSSEEVKTIVIQENQKTLSYLKWLFGFCIIQFIGLGALSVALLMK